MITQLNPPIPLETPKGKAWAVALIDYGPQWDLQWVTFVHDTGECWTFRNSTVRQGENYTFGLHSPTPISQPSISKTANGKSEGSVPMHNGNGLAPRENVN